MASPTLIKHPVTHTPTAQQRRATRLRALLKTLPKSIIVHGLLLALAATMVVPFLWMVLTSFKDGGEVFTVPLEWLPRTWHWENYPRALGMAPFGRFFLNSTIMALGIVAGRLLFATLGAYAFARLRWPGRDTIFLLYLATMMIPSQVTLIPSFLIIFWLKWINTYAALIVPSFASAFGVFLLRQFFLSIPNWLSWRSLVLWKHGTLFCGPCLSPPPTPCARYRWGCRFLRISSTSSNGRS